jgi:hypothetical protein
MKSLREAGDFGCSSHHPSGTCKTLLSLSVLIYIFALCERTSALLHDAGVFILRLVINRAD